MNASLWVVETDFLASTTPNLFPSNGNLFFNESFFAAIREKFSLQWKPSTLLVSSFLLAENVTDTSGNHCLKTDFILASVNSFFR